MTPLSIAIFVVLLGAGILCSFALGFVMAFWKTKAFLLGVRPAGISMLYRAAVVASLVMAVLMMHPMGLLVPVPAILVGVTVALIDVSHMDDYARSRFLAENKGRYSDPVALFDRDGKRHWG